jgi:hypothetical protein
MILLEEWDDEPRGIHAIRLHGDEHRRDDDASRDLQREFGAGGEAQVAAMRDFRVVVGESDGRVSADGKYGDPDETVAEVSPEERGNNDRDDDQQAAHGRRAGFFLVGLGSLFADVLSDLEVAQAADDERAHDQRGE